MKRICLALFLLNLCSLLSVAADENVRAAQEKLRQGGFYFGDLNGVYDNQTAAAVTRYQIREGLQITGKLDGPTAQALGTRALASGPADKGNSVSGTWRQLRNGEQQFVPTDSSPRPAPSSAKVETRVTRRTSPPPATSPPRPRDPDRNLMSRDRLRDYVGAFVLAGLDPQIGSELEFFADQVDYFGEGKVSREKMRRDLLRYDKLWPERRFWLAGEVDVRPEGHDRVRVTFPLRYELRSAAERASGTVKKTLVLQKKGNSDLEIVAVNEKKAR